VEAVQTLCQETTGGSKPLGGLEADEALLVRRAQDGEVSAFERLYRLHVGRVHGLCLRLTGRSQEAEEMTQEVFVRAWQHLHTFNGRMHFLHWLHRVATNLARNEWRARRRRGLPVALDEQHAAVAGYAPSAEAGLATDLDRAVAELPPGARTVFLLHDVHGYRHDEIAEMNGLAVGTTKAQLHRARRMLRKALSR